MKRKAIINSKLTKKKDYELTVLHIWKEFTYPAYFEAVKKGGQIFNMNMKIKNPGHLTQNLYTKFTLHLKEKISKQLHWPSVTKKPLYFLAVQDFSSPSLSPWKMLLFLLLDKLLLIAHHARSILVSLKQTNASQQKTKFSLANENLLTHFVNLYHRFTHSFKLLLNFYKIK